MSFAFDRLGAWCEPAQFEVAPNQVADYVAATNQTADAYRHLAPPVFALLPAIAVYPSQVEKMFDATLASMGSVHGEHELLIEKPITVSGTITTRAAVVGVHVKPSGTLVVVKTESRDERGALLNTQYAVQFLRGFDAGAGGGEVPPSWRTRDASRTEPRCVIASLRVDDDQAHRYAQASGDFGDYTLDAHAAQEAGFSRPILHGACTMALVAGELTRTCAAADQFRLRRLAVRFSAPCYPGDELRTTLWTLSGGDTRTDIVFEIADHQGRSVITNGVAAFVAQSFRSDDATAKR